MEKPWEILFRRAMAQMENADVQKSDLKNYTILPGGEHVRGKEIALCKQFVSDACQTLDDMWKKSVLAEPEQSPD